MLMCKKKKKKNKKDVDVDVWAWMCKTIGQAHTGATLKKKDHLASLTPTLP